MAASSSTMCWERRLDDDVNYLHSKSLEEVGLPDSPFTEVILISGYRGHGKTTLMKRFRHCGPTPFPYGYSVFGRMECVRSREHRIVTYTAKTFDVFEMPIDFTDITFAEPLKKAVAYELAIDWRNIDHQKDKELTRDEIRSHNWHFLMPQRPTIRDMLIDEAAFQRTRDPDVYVKAVANQLSEGKTFVIHDWRYQNEFEYLHNFCKERNWLLTTIRFFREDGPSSPLSTASEHNLDKFRPDYIITPPSDTCVTLQYVFIRTLYSHKN